MYPYIEMIEYGAKMYQSTIKYYFRRDRGCHVKQVLCHNCFKTYCETKSILGVCLGHQAIAENFGGELLQMKEVLHGINTSLYVTHSDPLFSELPDKWNVCHYHSWTVNQHYLPQNIIPTSIDDDSNILSLSHKTLRVKGVQFHPESYFTEYGKKIIQNWIEKC